MKRHRNWLIGEKVQNAVHLAFFAWASRVAQSLHMAGCTTLNRCNELSAEPMFHDLCCQASIPHIICIEPTRSAVLFAAFLCCTKLTLVLDRIKDLNCVYWRYCCQDWRHTSDSRRTTARSPLPWQDLGHCRSTSCGHNLPDPRISPLGLNLEVAPCTTHDGLVMFF